MPRTKKEDTSRQDLSFEFFSNLRRFYVENKSYVRKRFKELSKKILDFNDPDKGNSFLRRPQFEALEMYVFLKEFADNKKVHQIFQDWYQGINGFERNTKGLDSGNFLLDMFFSSEEEYKKAFNYLAKIDRLYSNYIFALTMGTGKTILMATCIYYEFILANKFRSDPRYCHNVLVFAPDTTVLQSLKEIRDFDVSKVLPPEYANFILTSVKYHYLSDTDTALSTQPNSMFNVIITNTQKIIIKKQHVEKTKAQQFFGAPSNRAEVKKSEIFGDMNDILGLTDGMDSDGSDLDLIQNFRFQRIAKLPRLGIFVDESHGVIGKELAKTQSATSDVSSLRLTIDELARQLQKKKSHVVACYNFTGTPYVGNSIMPEVVYAYGLADAIKNKYLKEAEPIGFSNIKSEDFVRSVIKDFWNKEGENRHEGMLPKLAFFASTVEELNSELRPMVERVLAEMGIDTNKILINVGDQKITKNDDIREFNMLDTPESNKQFILLVNKGREGWNCRSLFGVALFRKPKSTIFVLQATMRCLRSIGPNQETGHIYLSDENLKILDDELQRNFKVTLEEITKKQERPTYTVKLVPPPVKITINKVRRTYKMDKKKDNPTGLDFGLATLDYDKYRVVRTDRRSLLAKGFETVTEMTEMTSRVKFSSYSLVAEIARYFNNGEVSCFAIKEILETSKDGIKHILEKVNLYNDILYDVIIPIIYKNLYTITSTESSEPEEIELVKIKNSIEETVFLRKSTPELTIDDQNPYIQDFVEKSFNLNRYCFDSTPERDFFMKTLVDDRVEKIYFTGMLTHGESDFYINYIDPDSHTVRNYYPDFLIKTTSGKWLIIEVKGENKLNDPVVLAKQDYARQLATDNMFSYFMIGGHDAENYGLSALNYNKPVQGKIEVQ